MGIWVRSQNKEALVLCEELYLSFQPSLHNIFGKSIDCEGEYDINTNDLFLGTYSTKEKALKVLDMIQGNITGNKYRNLEFARDCPAFGIEHHNVFNMPQDEEVDA